MSAVKSFGAFVALENGVTGMVHISELSDKYVEKTEDFVSVGDEVTARVMSTSDGRIRLSMKACEKKTESFEELLSAYKKKSDERRRDLKTPDKPKKRR